MADGTRRAREIFDAARPNRPERSGGRRPWGVLTVLAVLALLVLIALVGWISGYEKTSGGEIAVVRNGGAFDNHKIRQVVGPASGLVFTGLWSDVHKYPAQQRFYTITADA